MRVENVRVDGLAESIIASGYAMRTQTSSEMHLLEPTEKEIERCKKLVIAGDKEGGHDQFLSGILVSFDLTFSNKAWVEAERYRFLTFVTSQSTMHRITSFDLEEQYNEYVDARVIEIMKEKVLEYNKMKETNASNEILTQKYLEILYTNPAGFELTARLTTNYRCLRNIYRQRKNHRLPEWREFCNWIELLPMAKEFLTGEEK